MAKNVTRIGDEGVGVCPNHPSPLIYTTTFTTGSATTSADGIPICIVGSLGTSTCGHETTALTGSSVSTADGMPIHRIDDTGQNYGTYAVTTASPNVVSD